MQIKSKSGQWETIGYFTGTSSNVWSFPYFDLSNYSDSEVRFAFYLKSRKIGTWGDVSSGWYIDSVQILPFIVQNISFSSEIAQEYLLFQNYPNPFNPTTTIKYALPKAANVKLEVFNVLGQRVATLVNGRRLAGYHQAIFNGSHLPSGVYYYRLTTDAGFGQTRKMILIQ